MGTSIKKAKEDYQSQEIAIVSPPKPISEPTGYLPTTLLSANQIGVSGERGEQSMIMWISPDDHHKTAPHRKGRISGHGRAT